MMGLCVCLFIFIFRVIFTVIRVIVIRVIRVIVTIGIVIIVILLFIIAVMFIVVVVVITINAFYYNYPSLLSPSQLRYATKITIGFSQNLLFFF